MICRNCGAEIPDTAKFCTRCGASLDGNKEETCKPSTGTSAQKAPRPKRKTRLFIIIAAIVVVVAAAVVLILTLGTSKTRLPEVEAGTWVYDGADVFSQQAVVYLEAKDKDLEEVYGTIVAIATMPKVKGWDDLSDFCIELRDQWGLTANDFILVMDIDGNDYRLIQGTDLADRFTDEMVRQYDWAYLEDDFAGKNYSAGAESLINALGDWLDEQKKADDLWYATTGIPGDKVLFTADGEDVTAALFFYWLAYEISYYDYYFSTYFDTSLDFSEFSEDFIEDAKKLAARTVLLGPKTIEMGYSLSDEMLEEINEDIKSTKDEYDSEEEFQDTLRKLGLDEELYTLLMTASYYATALSEGINEGGHPTHEELETYAEENDLMYIKDILILTVDSDFEPLDEEDLAERRALAENILEQLQNSENPEEDFDRLMNEYSEDTGLEDNPDGYLFTSGEMVSEVEDATRELEFGQISGIVEHKGTDGESYSGYHIILRLDPADSEELSEDWLNDQVNDIIYGWVDNAEYVYSDEYDKIDVEDFYAKYTEYQEAFAEEDDS